VVVPKSEGVLEYRINKSSILIPRVNLLIFWNAISFLVIAAIAFVFVKNQIRSIELLKSFANDFSYLEKDNSSFKPTGAKEIREVGWAFLNVVRKMRNLMNARTTMLAQISHDLRTPLTRIKLQIEFINDEDIVIPLRQDLEEMERMINEYLLFSRGIVEGNYNLTDIRQFFSGIVDDYRRSDYRNIFINFDLRGGDKVFLKVDSFRRCINNILNNSIRYRRKVIDISVKTNDSSLVVVVDDDGSGLEKDALKKIRKPFYSTEGDGDGNFGLGLSVVQHVVDMHRGKVYFGRAKTLGGMSVSMTIPLLKKPE
jgi:two-component system osmolarity sensor histidine kinase EnvZ